MDLSLMVIARDAEETIRACLESVPFAGQIVLVDSGSTDGTVAAAESCGAEVYHREFDGYGPQKQWALEKATSEMVLSLDSDEALSSDLAAAIERLLGQEHGGAGNRISGYRLRRRTCYMGRLLRFGPWMRDRPLRLFRRVDASFGDDRVHEKVVLGRGRTALLRRGWIIHRPYRDLDDHMSRMSTYASLWAKTQYDRGRRAGLQHMLLRPIWRFMLGYLIRGGFLEGLPGFMASQSSARYAFLKWSMLVEMQRADQSGDSDGKCSGPDSSST